MEEVDLIKDKIIKGILASEAITALLKTKNSKNINDLTESLDNKLSERLSKLFSKKGIIDDGTIKDILISQYNQHLLERRNLDILGWSIFVAMFAISVSTLGAILNSKTIYWPIQIFFLIIPFCIHLIGAITLKKIRISRHIHREIATAIEEYFGLFHLSITKITNKPLRLSHDYLINLTIYIYLFVIFICIVNIIINNIPCFNINKIIF